MWRSAEYELSEVFGADKLVVSYTSREPNVEYETEIDAWVWGYRLQRMIMRLYNNAHLTVRLGVTHRCSRYRHIAAELSGGQR